MPLGGMLPYPNAMPQGPQGAGPAGPVPPPGMAQPPSGIDASKLVMAFLNNLNPDEQKGAVYGIGMRELMRSMDLKRKQREGADGIPAGQESPTMGALRSSSPSATAAPLAPASPPSQGGFM